MSRSRWRGRVALATAAGLAVLGLGLTPAAEADTSPAPLAEVLRSLPLGDVPGLVVLLVDTSGSMTEQGLYPVVRTAVSRFTRSLSSADRVSVITFDAAPRSCVTGTIPAAATATIIGCLPGKAVGARTDFGRALDAAVSVLESDASGVRTLVLSDWSTALTQLGMPPTTTVSQPIGPTPGGGAAAPGGGAAAPVATPSRASTLLPGQVRGLLLGTGLLLLVASGLITWLIVRRGDAAGRPRTSALPAPGRDHR
jgi:von Willebrand factor type A domain